MTSLALPGTRPNWGTLDWVPCARLLFAATLALSGSVWAATDTAPTEVAVPPLVHHVSDLTGTLTPEQIAPLETRLADLEARKGSQLAVLIVPSTQPEDIAAYGIRVADQWKLGRKKVDDGAILLLAKDDHAVRIEVGYGLEGALNDATAERIISETIIPKLRAGDFAGGVGAGVDQMIKVVDGEALPPPARAASRRTQGSANIGQMVPMGILLAVVAGGVLRSLLGQTVGSAFTAGLVGALTWWLTGAVVIAVIAALIGFFVVLFGGRGGGGFGGWYGGGGGGFGGGGGGGGGFSGGGGGFGGGGASGRW